jgi:hypothetical protein
VNCIQKQKSAILLSFVPFFSFLLFISTGYSDQLLSAPANVRAFDTPNDGGNSITVEWDGSGESDVITYTVLRASVAIGDMKVIETIQADSRQYQYMDDKVERGNGYYYLIQARDRVGNTANSQIAGPVIPAAQWFRRPQLPTALSIVIFSGMVIFWIYHARSGRQPYIRRISGLEAIDEAIGRATEMGKSVLYISGIADIRSIATIASMNVLARVARITAEYDTLLLVPCKEPIVMNIEREVVQNAYMDAGRPDAYKQENIFFITDDQFAYAAAVDGIIIREKPAAIFYMGAFMAESLILSEVGNAVGAVQVAGTDSITQLPFFITACDYTLMGEELYAASAYLSEEPMLLGSLKGQDWGKLLVIASLLVGAILQLLGFDWLVNLFRI